MSPATPAEPTNTPASAPLGVATQLSLDPKTAIDAGLFAPHSDDFRASKIEIGQIFGGEYRILRRIGIGGMGEVFLAERAEGDFQQQVALKTLLPGHGNSANVLSRLLAERQILATLSHPNIATLLGGGSDERGMPYLVMEYIEGERIDSYCSRLALSAKQRVQLFVKVCAAVSHAHQHLVVHRDLKPDNILVNASGEPKVLDFGIAKLLGDDMGGHSIQTETGFSPMTQRYASPEQVRAQKIGTSSDVYGLGVVLYELLCGRLPYRDADLQNARINYAISEVDPPMPSQSVESAQLGVKPTQLKGELDAILLKALRKSPVDRYAFVELLTADLQRFLNGESVDALKGDLSYRWSRALRRNWLAIAAISALIAWLSAMAWNFKTRLDTAERERLAEAQTTQFLRELFLQIDPTESENPQLSARELINAGRNRLAKGFVGQAAVRESLEITLGEVYLNLGDVNAAQALLAHPYETREALSPALRAQTVIAFAKLQLQLMEPKRVLSVLSELHASDSSSIASTQLLLEASTILNDVTAVKRLIYQLDSQTQNLPAAAKIDALLVKLDALWGTGESAGCLAMLQAEKPSLETQLSQFQMARLLSQESKCLDNTGEPVKALVFADRVLTIVEKQQGKTSANFAAALEAKATILANLSRFMESDTLLVRAFDLFKANGQHTATPRILVSRARNLRNQGQIQTAINLSLQALAIANEKPQELRDLRGRAHNVLALSYADQKQFDLAAEHYQLALKALAGLAPGEPAFILYNLGRLYCDDLKNADAGIEVMNQAQRLFAANMGSESWTYGNAKSNYGACLALAGRVTEARVELTAAIPILRKAFGEKHDRTRYAIRRLANLEAAVARGDRKPDIQVY